MSLSGGSDVVDVETPIESKPGPQTTEFWLAIFTNVMAAAQLTGVWEYLPDGQNKWVVIALAIVNAVYALGRGAAKSGVPYGKS